MPIQLPQGTSETLAPLRLPRANTGYRVSPLEFVGRGLGDVGDTFARIQYAADVSESGKALRDANANMGLALTNAAQKYKDPNEFAFEASRQLNDIQQGAIESASSPRVRQTLNDHLPNMILEHQKNIATLKYNRLLDIAKGNYLLERDSRLEDATKAVSMQDEALYDKIEEDHKNTLTQQIFVGTMDQEAASKDLLAFNRSARSNGLALYAKTKPDEFTEKADSGSLANKYDSLDIQRSTEIADRTINTRVAREREANRRDGIGAERDFITQAKEGKLNDEELLNAQIKYDWPQSKVDQIKRIQLGVGTSSPDAQSLISKAMEPSYKEAPTLGDLNQAAKNLNALAGQVSLDSNEWKAAMNRLQYQKSILTFRGTAEQNRERAEENRLRSAAKNSFRNWADSTGYSREDSESYTRDRGTLYNQIDQAPASQAKKLTEDFIKNKSVTDKDKTKEAVDRAKGLLR